jgi:hypothetical protein
MKHIKNYKELKESLKESVEYAVVLTGGSIGDKPRPRDARGYVGMDASGEELLTKEKANERAKRMNKDLSPGEKKFYKLKFIVVPVSNNKFIRESVDETQINEKVKTKDIGIGTVLNFKDGEVWKVTGIIGQSSNPRGYFAKPHDENTKKTNTSMEIELTTDFLQKELESINEASTSWSKMMNGVKRGESGPWTIVGIENKRVVSQNIVEIRDLLPAKFETMAKENPRAKFHIEDSTGAVVWSEK